MKRKTKNIIMIFALILLFALNGLTVYLATEHSTNMLNSNMPSMGENNRPPEMSSGDNNLQEENDNGTPPEKPTDDNSSSNGGSNDISKMPSSPNNGNVNESGVSNGVNNSKVDTIYIVLFGIESLFISGILIYLLMSSFNKKSIREVFVSNDKVLIYVLSLVILTSFVTVLDTFTSNKIMNSSSKEIGNNGSNTTYTASLEITSNQSISDTSYESTTKDENVILVSGDVTASLSNVTVNKTGDSDGGDNTSFYGTNSAITGKDGAKVILKNAKITTNATGANGVFSYGGSATTNNSSSDGTTVEISDSTITTTKDNSGGIMTTGGGIMKATNLTINTSGVSSAAIRTDRGGGVVTVSKGTYTTTGQGSPSIYSTADVTVSDATLVSKASEGVVIEGKNSVTLENVILNDTNNKLNGQSTTYKNIFLYQSMSGDAETGDATFTSKNSTITTNKGDSLYVTNTSAVINLINNKIINNDSTGNFLRIQKDSWGTSGSNGGTVKLNMTNQDVEGNIVVDSISTLTISMSNSSYVGSINKDNTAKSISLVLDKNSSIKLTGDSYVTSLSNKDSSNSNIDFNGYKLYVNGKAIN